MGDRLDTLRKAVGALASIEHITVQRLSSVYETAPVGVTDQPAFLNVNVVISTPLEPESLLDVCQSIEKQFGRVRDRRWGPRTLDIDIIFIEGQIIETERLVVPHKEMHRRAFVLVPLLELEMDRLVRGKACSEWLKEIDTQEEQKVSLFAKTVDWI